MGSIDQVLAEIQTRWGAAALAPLSTLATTTETLPTGLIALDAFLPGGIPRGKLTLLLGTPTCGRTTLAFHLGASAQQSGDLVVILDLSSTFDGDWAVRCGVDLGRLLLVRPEDATQIPDLITALLDFRIGLIILDASTAQLTHLPLRLLAPLARSRCALLVLSATDHAVEQAALALRIGRLTWRFRQRDVCGYQVRITVEANKLGLAGKSVTLELAAEGT